jgi:hypothetical protein
VQASIMPHIHFGDDDPDAAMDEALPESVPQAPQASTSGRSDHSGRTGPAMLVPTKTIYTTFGKVEDPDYVFDIVTK